jgi:hypothetical protein
MQKQKPNEKLQMKQAWKKKITDVIITIIFIIIAFNSDRFIIDRFESWIIQKMGLCQTVIIERTKRPESIDVRKFFHYTPELEQTIELCNRDPEKLLEWTAVSIKYITDQTDYWKFASETLIDGYGDCDDGSILLANLLLQSGQPYYKVFIAIYGTHVVVVFDRQLYDWTRPKYRLVPPISDLWYCWNSRNAYTTMERINEWRK